MNDETLKARARVKALLETTGLMESVDIQNILREEGLLPTNFGRLMRSVGASTRKRKAVEKGDLTPQEWFIPKQ